MLLLASMSLFYGVLLLSQDRFWKWASLLWWYGQIWCTLHSSGQPHCGQYIYCLEISPNILMESLQTLWLITLHIFPQWVFELLIYYSNLFLTASWRPPRYLHEGIWWAFCISKYYYPSEVWAHSEGIGAFAWWWIYGGIWAWHCDHLCGWHYLANLSSLFHILSWLPRKVCRFTIFSCKVLINLDSIGSFLWPFETLPNTLHPRRWSRSDIFQGLGQKPTINGDNTLESTINTDRMM